MRTTAAPPPAVGTGTRLRLTACTEPVLTNFKGKAFVSTVQVLNAQGALVADNPTSISVAVSVTGIGATAGPLPNVLTVPPLSSVTSESTSVTMDNGSSNNGKNEFVVSVSASGLATATCTVRK